MGDENECENGVVSERFPGAAAHKGGSWFFSGARGMGQLCLSTLFNYSGIVPHFLSRMLSNESEVRGMRKQSSLECHELHLKLAQGQLEAYRPSTLGTTIVQCYRISHSLFYTLAIASKQILLLAMQSGDVFYSMQSRTTRPAAKIPPQSSPSGAWTPTSQ